MFVRPALLLGLALAAAPARGADPAAPPARDPAAPAAAPAAGPWCEQEYAAPQRVWASAEWLYWATSGSPTPALVTAAAPGSPRATAGTLGAPGTTTLLGANRLNNDFRNGFRARAGVWLDDDQQCGLEADFFFLGRSNQGGAFGSDGSAILTRPFVDANTGLPAAQLVSFPGVLAGTVTAGSTSNVIGGGFNYLQNCCGCSDDCGRFDTLIGFRYLNLRDDLTATEDLTALGAARVPAGTRLVVSDRFRTTNDFYGANVGGQYGWSAGRFFASVRGSVALGVTHYSITADGSTTITPPGGTPAVFPGGLLAQPSNMGTRSGDAFAVVPEVGLRAGYQVADGVRVFAGYDFIYWSRVARAGDQIDPRVNPNQLAPARLPLAGPPLPAPVTNTTDNWLQGISVGAELRF